jgi:cytochrome c-type biogenesis protein CcmH
MIRRLLAATAVLLALAATPAFAAASLPAIERQVMCVTCKIPLMVAESSQADSEREYIRGLIAKGENEEQIKQRLLAQYGPAVLALPQTSGFDLTAYLVPVVVVLGGVILLIVLIPRWRRRDPAPATGAALSAEQRARIDEDMAQAGN